MYQRKNGFILISTILLLGISSMLVLTSSHELIQHSKIVNNQKDYIQCFYAADGALMRFRKMLATTLGFDIQSQIINTTDSSLQITRTADVLSASSNCKNAQMTLDIEVADITIEEVNPQWTMP